MKHIFTFFLFLGLITTMTAQNAAEYACGQLIVQYKSKEAYQRAASLRINLDTKKLGAIAELLIELWELPKDCKVGRECLLDPTEWAAYLAKNEENISFSQPNYMYGAGSIPPNDTAFFKQWYLHNAGWNGGTAGVDMGALAAWDIRREAKYARVGIMDTGIDWKHPDLAPNVFRNLGEDADHDSTTLVWNGSQWVLDPGDLNGIDDDNNGYIDDVIGWDFVNNDNNPMDDNGHGTHVSGIIGAKQNNTIGISGIAGAGIQIMPLKCLDESGTGYSFAILLALQYSVNKGVMVTNHSYGGGVYDSLMFSYIDNNCKQAGQLLVAAAGNNHVNNDSDPMYPASYDSDIVISVGAHDNKGNPCSFSNFGSNSVDIFAPGDAIYSTDLNGTHSFRSGTSMAAPMVTAAVVLARKQFAISTPNTVKGRILNAAKNEASLNELSLSNGRLDLLKTLSLPEVAKSICDGWEAYQGDVNVSAIATDANYEWIGTDGNGLIRITVATGEKIFYTTCNSGLLYNRISSILIDSLGNKWIGYFYGSTSIFDGTTWTKYDTTNSSVYTPPVVMDNTIDNQGNKWFISSGGVQKFDGTTWTTYDTTNSGLVSDFVTSIAIDTQGNKWFGTNSGVSKFNDTTWTTYDTTNSGLVSNSVTSIVIDNQGNKWFVTGSNVSKFDGTTWTTYTTANCGLVSNSVNSIAVGTQGTKWFGTNSGVSKFDGTTWTTYTTVNSGLVGNNITSIIIDEQGNKWFGTNSGVSMFNDTTWITYTTANSGLVGNNITSIIIDAQGNKWFGTNSGVSMFDGTTWTNYTTANSGLVENYVTSIAIDAQGNKWFGTGNGVSMFDGTTWTNYTATNSGLAQNYIASIAIDTKGNKWFVFGWGDHRISKFDDTTWTTYTSDYANCVATDIQGNKWFGLKHGVSKFDDTDWTTYYHLPANSGITGDKVNFIAIDAQDNKWIMTDIGGVSKFSSTNTSFGVSKYKLCLGETLTFTNLTTEADSFTWKVNTTTVSNDTNLTYTFPSAGVHRVELIAHKGTLDKSFFQYITVRTPVQVQLGNDTTVCHASYVIDAGVAAEKYRWKNLAGTLLDPDSTHEEYYVTGVGVHTVVLEAVDYCGAVDRDTITVTISPNDCVLPGDVNADGSVDMKDFLALKALHGQIGIPRPNASSLPYYQTCPNWSSWQPSPYNTVNKKHADCDGNGIIDILTDGAVIKQNATRIMRNQGRTDSTVYTLKLKRVNYNPYQWFYPWDTVWHEVILSREDGQNPSNISKLAFNVRYNLNNMDLPTYNLGNSFLANPYGMVIRKGKNIDFGIISILGNNAPSPKGNGGKIGTVKKDKSIDTTHIIHSIFVTLTLNNAAVGLGNGTSVRVHSNTSSNTETVEYRLPWTRLDLKAILQGAYDSTLQIMRTDLRNQNIIPKKHPYGDIAPFKEVEIPAGVVDWVEVQLRSANNPTSANIVERRAAFLMQDGTICSPYAEDSGHLYVLAKAGDYYVVINHRNHLSVMSQTPVYISANPAQNAAYDFTTNATYNNGHVQMWGKNMLPMGDANANGIVSYNGLNSDRESILNKLNAPNDKTKVILGYYKEDVNLDGKVKYSGEGNDRAYILRNLGGTNVNAILQTQVPQ